MSNRRIASSRKTARNSSLLISGCAALSFIIPCPRRSHPILRVSVITQESSLAPPPRLPPRRRPPLSLYEELTLSFKHTILSRLSSPCLPTLSVVLSLPPTPPSQTHTRVQEMYSWQKSSGKLGYVRVCMCMCLQMRLRLALSPKP